MIVFKNKEYSNDELQKIINESTSISEILRKMDVRDVMQIILNCLNI